MLPRWLWLDFVESPFVVTREQQHEIRRIARRLAARSPPRRPAMPGMKERAWRRWVRPVEKAPGLVDLLLGVYVLTLLANVACIPMSPGSVVVVSVQILLWVHGTALLHQVWRPWYRLRCTRWACRSAPRAGTIFPARRSSLTPPGRVPSAAGAGSRLARPGRRRPRRPGPRMTERRCARSVSIRAAVAGRSSTGTKRPVRPAGQRRLRLWMNDVVSFSPWSESCTVPSQSCEETYDCITADRPVPASADRASRGRIRGVAPVL